MQNKYFLNHAAEFVYTRTYAKWRENDNRREKWPETIQRYIDFIQQQRGDLIPPKVIKKMKNAILNFEVMPSMRALWSAGAAAEADNTTMYNCSFLCVDSIEAFSECLYILMCGAGVGFSVATHEVDKLPVVPRLTAQGAGTIYIEDSKAGWADSVKSLMQSLYSGMDIAFNYSKIRKAGEKLKTMGGRASGPEPLILLHNFIRTIFESAQGRKLTTLECHDIMNQIAEVVVVGGVRRSSEISLSDLDDVAMRNAKVYPFPLKRSMANNSAIYNHKPTAVEFMNEWSQLASSGTGERGIFNLYAARKLAPSRRDSSLIVGTNPCAEILMRNKQFCNLTEVVMRHDDDLDSLLEKIETATWMGAIQSTFTYFPYLRKEWQINCEEERLLGVSLTGQMDAKHLLNAEVLKALKARAIKIAKKASKELGVNFSAAITCVKPSGTVSQVVDSASGMHDRFDDFYLRRYRISSSDPLFKMMKSQNFPCSPENGECKKSWSNAVIAELNGKNPLDICRIYKKDEQWSADKVQTWVVSFPMCSPSIDGAREAVSAIKQLEHYKLIMQNYCEHNASMTIYVKDEEWLEVGNWVYNNWEIVSGVSFLPHYGGKYEQMPYESLTKEQYEKMSQELQSIDYSQLALFEQEDSSEGAKTYACSGGSCEL